MEKKILSIKEIEKLKLGFNKGNVDVEPIINLVSSAIYVDKSPLIKAYKLNFLENSDYTNLMIIASSMTNEYLKHKYQEPHFIHKANRIYKNYVVEHDGYDFVVSTEGKELLAPGVNINSLNDNEEMQKAVVSFILNFNKDLIKFGDDNTPERMKQFYMRMKAKGIINEVLNFDIETFIKKYATHNISNSDVVDTDIYDKKVVNLKNYRP